MNISRYAYIIKNNWALQKWAYILLNLVPRGSSAPTALIHCAGCTQLAYKVLLKLFLAHVLESWPKCININTFRRNIKMQSFVTAVAVILIGSLQLAAPMVSFIHQLRTAYIHNLIYVIWEELKVHQLHGSYCHIRSYEGFSSHSHSPNPNIQFLSSRTMSNT